MSVIRKYIPQNIINEFKHKPEAFLANIKNNFPSRGMKIIGVTGTDGKTTTVNMIYQILKAAGKKVSMVSTINAVIGKKEIETGFHVTSPSSFIIQKILSDAKNAGSEYVVLEVTSHSLDQHRFLGIKFDIGVITNITHEHLDYHRTWTNYFNTKAKLIKNVKVAVLNKDENHFSKLSKITNGQVVSFGLKKADFNPENFPLKLKIPGAFNILNALAAAAVCSNLGVDKKIIPKVLGEFKNLPGRMEEVKNDRGLKIVIDFAHTPNGLEQSLIALRTQAWPGGSGRLISIVGAEGQRDIKKRPMMGEIAQKMSDVVIVTAVDPRGEIKAINKQIKKGALKSGAIPGKNFYIISDRAKAIYFAINQLSQKGDTIGLFGKGHETSMNVDGTGEMPWSDRKVIEKILNGK